jgi:hypothetical protein
MSQGKFYYISLAIAAIGAVLMAAMIMFASWPSQKSVTKFFPPFRSGPDTLKKFFFHQLGSCFRTIYRGWSDDFEVACGNFINV